MGDKLTEVLVRQWLRDHAGQVYCAECLVKALGPAQAPGVISPGTISATLEELAHQPQTFWTGACLCGEPGLRYGW